MAGSNPPKPASGRPPSSSNSAAASHQKHRRESTAKNPSSDAKPSPSISNHPKSKPSPNLSKAPNPTTSTQKPPTSNSNPNPNPKPTRPSPRPDLEFHSQLPPFPFPDPPPPPSYGFHLLDRRSIALADGSVRSYLALPPDYEDIANLPRPNVFGLNRQFPMSPEFRPEFQDRFGPNRNLDYWNSLGLDGPGGGLGPEGSMKRKFGDEFREGDEGFERQRHQLLQQRNLGPGPSGLHMGRGAEEIRPNKYMRMDGSGVRLKHNEVDQGLLRTAFLHFVKLVIDNANQKRNYLSDGKLGPIPCLACSRSSKNFPDMHELIMHTYNPDSADTLVDHLGFHKALCILMGWNFLTPPDNSKSYQLLSADRAEANRDDLILWPPFVIIHNTITGKGKEGRMEGLGNRMMDNKIRELGYSGGKAMSIYGRNGHLGITAVRFASDESGLKEAIRLAEYFEKDKRGRKDWASVQSSTFGNDDDTNPKLVKVDQQTGEKKRIFYGYLATISDLDKVGFELRKKVVIESMRDHMPSR